MPSIQIINEYLILGYVPLHMKMTLSEAEKTFILHGVQVKYEFKMMLCKLSACNSRKILELMVEIEMTTDLWNWKRAS